MATIDIPYAATVLDAGQFTGNFFNDGGILWDEYETLPRDCGICIKSVSYHQIGGALDQVILFKRPPAGEPPSGAINEEILLQVDGSVIKNASSTNFSFTYPCFSLTRYRRNTNEDPNGPYRWSSLIFITKGKTTTGSLTVDWTIIPVPQIDQLVPNTRVTELRESV